MNRPTIEHAFASEFHLMPHAARLAMRLPPLASRERREA